MAKSKKTGHAKDLGSHTEQLTLSHSVGPEMCQLQDSVYVQF